MKKSPIRNAIRLTCISLILTCAVYSINLWLLSSNPRFSPTDALFIEGIISIILGALLLLGSGGINLWSRKAAILAATAEAAYGTETIGPSEIFRRDAWKPKGFVRLGLILIIAGVFMLIIYFALI